MSQPLKIHRNGLNWATPSTGLAIASAIDEFYEDVPLDTVGQAPEPLQSLSNANCPLYHIDPPPQRLPRDVKIRDSVARSPSRRVRNGTRLHEHHQSTRRLSLLPDISQIPPEDSLKFVKPSSRLFRSESAKGKFDDLFFAKDHVFEKQVIEPAIQPYYNRECDVIAFAENLQTDHTFLCDLKHSHLRAASNAPPLQKANLKSAPEQLSPLKTSGVRSYAISGKTAGSRMPGLLNLPVTDRHRIWSYLFPCSEAVRTILLTPTCTGNQVFPDNHFEHFLSIMTPEVRAAMLTCRALKNELSAYFWSTFKFHMTITGFSCALINSAIKKILPIYSQHIQHLTIEVDLTKLGFSPRRNALYLGKALDRIGHNLRVVVSALVQRPVEMAELHIMCRRYKGRRPTWNSQIDVGGCGRRTLYCCDAPLAIFDCVKGLKGRLGKLRMSGFSKKYTEDMVFHLFAKPDAPPTCVVPTNPAWPNYYLVAPGETLPFIHSVSGTTSGEELPPTIATPFECAEELALATGALDLNTSVRFRDAILHARSEVLVPSRASLYVDDVEETLCTAFLYQDRFAEQFGVVQKTRRRCEQENTPRQEAINFRDDDGIAQNDEQDQHFGMLAGLNVDERGEFLSSLSSRQLEHLYRFIDYRKMPGGGALFSKLESCLVTDSRKKFKRAEVIMYHAGYESEKARRSRMRPHKRLRYQPQPLIVPVLLSFMRRHARARSDAITDRKEVGKRHGRWTFRWLPSRMATPTTRTTNRSRAQSNTSYYKSTLLATPRSVDDPQFRRRRSSARYFSWFQRQRTPSVQCEGSSIELRPLANAHTVADLSPFDGRRKLPPKAVSCKHTSSNIDKIKPRSVGNALSQWPSTFWRRFGWSKAYRQFSSEHEGSPFERNLARPGPVVAQSELGSMIQSPPIAVLDRKPHEYHMGSSHPQNTIRSSPTPVPDRQPYHMWSPYPQARWMGVSNVAQRPVNMRSSSPVTELDRLPNHLWSPYSQSTVMDAPNVAQHRVDLNSPSPVMVSSRQPYHMWSPYPPSRRSEPSDMAQRSVTDFV